MKEVTSVRYISPYHPRHVPMFSALHSGSVTLHLINDDNLAEVSAKFQGYPDSEELLAEMAESYLPHFEDGRRTNYGFYAVLGTELAGLCLLTVHDWQAGIASTGADILRHMRGRGVAPSSKPHLFYLAFELLKLNRVETGCLVSNIASKRSIEKTPGFQFEGVSRESGINEQGNFEDQYLYAILKRDWLRLYDKSQVQVIG
jgi:RimJ/RimL family protein N-acetyltransferase